MAQLALRPLTMAEIPAESPCTCTRVELLGGESAPRRPYPMAPQHWTPRVPGRKCVHHKHQWPREPHRLLARHPSHHRCCYHCGRRNQVVQYQHQKPRNAIFHVSTKATRTKHIVQSFLAWGVLRLLVDDSRTVNLRQCFLAYVVAAREHRASVLRGAIDDGRRAMPVHR